MSQNETLNFNQSEYDVIENENVEDAEAEADENTPLFRNDSSDSEDFDSTSTVDSSHSNRSWLQKFGPIILGQIASVLICFSGVTSKLLSNSGLSYPSIQNVASYFLISIVFTTKLAISTKRRHRRQTQNNIQVENSQGSSRSNRSSRSHLEFVESEDFVQIFKKRGWKYLLITLADVGGNYLVVRAYQFTSLTSVQLLDCFSIPTVLFLSYIFLKSRYRYFHFLGISLCLVGVGCLVWADIDSGRTSEGSQPLIGDLLCLSGAFLYGVSNVAQEFFVKNFKPFEFLGFVGLFGTFIAGAQAILLEETSLDSWDTESILLLLAFALVQFLFYTIVAHLLAMSSSVALNLSILSADFYSILVGVFMFKYHFNVLYFLSFVLVIGGVGIFSLNPSVPAIVPDPEPEPDVVNTEYPPASSYFPGEPSMARNLSLILEDPIATDTAIYNPNRRMNTDGSSGGPAPGYSSSPRRASVSSWRN